MTDVTIKLLQNPKISTHPSDVLAELERLSGYFGIDLSNFVEVGPNGITFTCPTGYFSPDNFPNVKYDSPESFALFFLLATSYPLAVHQRAGVEFCWQCWADKKGAILEWARGMGKSILVRVLVAYLMGLYPGDSSLIIRQAAQPAQQAAADIAQIISDNLAWQVFYPYLVAKSNPGQPGGGGWSAQSGYSVIDKRLSPAEQATMEASRTSPSLTRYGVGQSQAIGTGVTCIGATDDIHSVENSESPTQLESLIKHFQTELQPIMRPGSRQVLICTRYSDDDLPSLLPETGEWRKLVIPITIDGQYPGTPTWPQMRSEEEIDRLYAGDTTPNKRDFAKNRLLKIVFAADTHFTYLAEPHADIVKWYPVAEKRIGVDYASASVSNDSVRSHTAIVTISRNPHTRRWVVTAVQAGQFTQSQSELQVRTMHAQSLPCFGIFVEQSGSGPEFTAQLQRLFGLNVVGIPMQGHGSKDTRYQRDLQPLLASGAVTISDEKTPGLEQLRSALARYPNFRSRGDIGEDILDALWIALYYCLVADYDPFGGGPYNKERKANPWMTLARIGMD